LFRQNLDAILPSDQGPLANGREIVPNRVPKTPRRDHRLSFGGSGVDRNTATASERVCGGNRIEWTGAGGDYFLAVVVDQDDEVIAERWATQKEVLVWMKKEWPHLRVKYVPMVYGRNS
jgi:hypothetical protein